MRHRYSLNRTLHTRRENYRGVPIKPAILEREGVVLRSHSGLLALQVFVSTCARVCGISHKTDCMFSQAESESHVGQLREYVLSCKLSVLYLVHRMVTPHHIPT